MTDFNLLGFAAHLGKLIVAEVVETEVMLTEAAKVVQKEAKAEIGTYQSASGPFAAWAELADSTKSDRVAKGFTENDPLLRTGEMRDSIEYTVAGREAHIGSDNDKAVWQELGTDRIPPRSFLGGAAFRKGPEIAHAIGAETFAYLCGAGVHGGKLPIK